MTRGVWEYDVLTDGGDLSLSGNVDVEVRRESDDALASLTSDRAGNNGLSNPFSVTSGRIKFYALNNELYRVELSGDNTSRDLRNQSVSQQGMGGINVDENDNVSGHGVSNVVETGDFTLSDQAHKGRDVEVPGGANVTVPEGLSDGFACTLWAAGTSDFTLIESTTNVTIRSKDDLKSSNGQWSAITISRRISANEYKAAGDMS